MKANVLICEPTERQHADITVQNNGAFGINANVFSNTKVKCLFKQKVSYCTTVNDTLDLTNNRLTQKCWEEQKENPNLRLYAYGVHSINIYLIKINVEGKYKDFISQQTINIETILT